MGQLPPRAQQTEVRVGLGEASCRDPRCVGLLPRCLFSTSQVLSSLGYHVVTFDYRGESPLESVRVACSSFRAALGVQRHWGPGVAATCGSCEREQRQRGQGLPVRVLRADAGACLPRALAPGTCPLSVAFSVERTVAFFTGLGLASAEGWVRLCSGKLASLQL